MPKRNFILDIFGYPDNPYPVQLHHWFGPFWKHTVAYKGVSTYSTAEVIVEEIRIELYSVRIYDFSWQREIRKSSSGVLSPRSAIYN